MKRSVVIFIGVISSWPMIGQAQTVTSENQELLQRLAQGDSRALPPLVTQGAVVVPELSKLLLKSGREEKALVALALAEIAHQVGPRAKEAIPALCDTLKSSDRAAASSAARAPGAIGGAAVPDVTRILEALEQTPQAIYPVRALGHVGPGAKDAVPAVTLLLKSTTDSQIRIACIRTLGAIGPGAQPAMKDLLLLANANAKKRSPHLAHLLVALGAIGPGAESAIPLLAKIMQEAPEPHLRLCAMEGLTRINPKATELPESMLKMLEGHDLPRAIILESLGRMASLDKRMLKAAEESLRDKDAMVRLHAASVVGKTNPDHPAVVSILIESLNDRDPAMRRQSAEAIGVVRPSDEAVIEALKQHLADSDPTVRESVAQTLARFKKK